MRLVNVVLTVVALGAVHAGTQPHPAMPAGSACGSCHANVTAKEFVHEPARMACTLCHDEQQPSRLHAEGNALCLECHSTDAQKKFESDQAVVLFGGKVKLTPKPFRELHLLALANDRGHPVSNHPVLKKADKDSPAIACLTCHNPHGTNHNSYLLVTDVVSPVSLCQRCHK